MTTPSTKQPEPASRQGGLEGPIAYLTGNYPMISHTFILREVQALRQQGLKILTCSIRPPVTTDFTGPDEISALRDTFYVLPAARRPMVFLAAHLEALVRSPWRWFSTLRLAWATRPPGLRAGLWQIFYFLEAVVLARHLRQAGAVHIHNHFANSSCSVAMLTSEMSGIPFSFTLHGPAIFYEAHWWRLDEKVARARFVSCISHFSRSQAMYFSDPAHWDKLRIIHCGVNLDAYGKHPRKGFGRNVLFVGRLDAVKGVPLLLEAFAEARRVYSDVRLMLVGDGPARHALEAQVERLGIGEAVEFLGFRAQSEVAALLDAADILVLPSFAEGLPVVLMEAMASHLPVIASAVAGVPELVEDGVAGFTVPAGDLLTLTERLMQLLGDQALRARMGAAGRTKVEAEFNASTEAGKLAEEFRRWHISIDGRSN